MYRDSDPNTGPILTITDLTRSAREEIRKHRSWYFFESLLFLAAGIGAIALPGVTTMAAALVVSLALCAGGLVRLINAFRFPTGRGWRLLSGAIFLAAGGTMLWWPAEGIDTLVIIIGAFLFAEGLIEIFLSLTYRPLFRWGALLVSGLMSLVLGTLIFTFPITGVIFIAFAVGLSMIFYGLSLLMFTWKANS
jgi:uncharacterized membrane protein HdeD (DUF308 family)